MKRLLLAVLLILPLGAHASTQVLVGSMSAFPAAATRSFDIQFAGPGTNGTTGVPLPISGTISNFTASATTTPPAGEYFALKLIKNNIETSVGCVIGSGSASCTDPFHTLSFATNDILMVQVAPINDTNPLLISWGAAMTPAVSGNTVIGFFHGLNNLSATAVLYPIADTAISAATGLAQSVFPEAGSINLLTCGASVAPGVGTSRSFYTMLNGATTTSDCYIGDTNTQNQDTTNAQSVAAGDLYNYSTTPSTTPALGFGLIAQNFRPTTSGDFDFFSGATFTSAAGGFFNLSGRVSVTQTIESFVQQVAPVAMTFTAIRASATAAPGTTATRAFTLDVNGVASALTCTMTSAVTICSGSASVSVNAGDLLSINNARPGTAPASAVISVSLAATGAVVSSPTTKKVVLTSGSSWTVPSDFTSTNSIECIGAGGSGAAATANTNAGGGGGAGAYGRLNRLLLTPSTNITYSIAAGGSLGDTYFNGAASTTASLSCAPGRNGSGSAAGVGGNFINGAYSLSSGGNGGAGRVGTGNSGGGGGGGSGGPFGSGFTAGAGLSGAGGGGAGSDGGSGSAGVNAAGGNGGAGGNGTGGTGSGTGATGAGGAPTSGTNGGGGGGGSTNGAQPGAGNGGTDTSFDSTHGAGGGGGGGGGQTSSTAGASTYGGGGGGAGAVTAGTGTPATGGSGIIVITYVPKASSSLLLCAEF